MGPGRGASGRTTGSQDRDTCCWPHICTLKSVCDICNSFCTYLIYMCSYYNKKNFTVSCQLLEGMRQPESCMPCGSTTVYGRPSA